MSKVGRNDPCPCGSGRKYKQCCLNGREGGKKIQLPDYLDPKEIARRWMGEDPVSSGGALRDDRGVPLQLVLDRFSIVDPQAVTAVRSLGKSEDERVLFFEGDQWIGEADFSAAQEMQLITPNVESADQLLSLVEPIVGLQYLGRQADEFPMMETGAPLKGGAELLQFKKMFFETWPNEPNERLGGATPRDAVRSPELKIKLEALVRELESKESQLPKKERYSFKELKKRLGIV